MNKNVQQWVMLMAFSLAFSAGSAWAYELKSMNDPIPVISGVNLSAQELSQGGDFHATLSEPIQYQGMTLPEGTQFVGHIEDIKRITPMTGFHHVDIWIDKVVFDNGKYYAIYPNEQIKPHLRFHPRTQSKQRTANRDILMDAGQKLQLRFNPSTMKGLFEASASQ